MQIEAQLSVFLDNRPGMLARTCQALARERINLRALSILDTVDHAMVRMVVDRPQDAERVLSELHATVQRRDVIVMDLENEAGAMALVAERLAAAGINIEYAYCTASATHSGGVLVLRTNDLEATINALS